jgi:aminoglycoside phosphotransferase (APT) family kinase protein
MSGLPAQLVHGDIKVPNVCRVSDGRTLYLDFGLLARRPRIHDLAFTLTYTVLAHEGEPLSDPRAFQLRAVADLVAAYEAAAGWRLTTSEKQALTLYVVAVRLFFAASAYRDADPAACPASHRKSVEFGNWLPSHRDGIQ